jgi:hypothetical protein
VATPSEAEITAYLIKLQNPYAKLSVYDDPPLDEAAARSDYLRRLQNPYASLGVAEISQSGNQRGDKADAKKRTISKADFQSRCRAILFQYVPLAETRGRLRAEFRDFIAKNSDRSGDVRHKVLHELERYDLSVLGDVKPHLNRERQEALLAKLKKISSSFESS